MNPPQRDAGIVGSLHMQAGNRLMNAGNDHISHRSMIYPQIGANIEFDSAVITT